MRYAVSSATNEFHLVTETEDETLCGLSVAPIIINRPAMSTTLYLTENVGNNRRLCERCAVIKNKPDDRSS